jgi:hypothetical protein
MPQFRRATSDADGDHDDADDGQLVLKARDAATHRGGAVKKARTVLGGAKPGT